MKQQFQKSTVFRFAFMKKYLLYKKRISIYFYSVIIILLFNSCFFLNQSSSVVIKNDTTVTLRNITLEFNDNGNKKIKVIDKIGVNEYAIIRPYLLKKNIEKNLFKIEYMINGTKYNNNDEKIFTQSQDNNDVKTNMYITNNEYIGVSIQNTYFYVMHFTKDEYIRKMGKIM